MNKKKITWFNTNPSSKKTMIESVKQEVPQALSD